MVKKGLGQGLECYLRLEGKNEMCLNRMAADPHRIIRSVWELCAFGDENE